MYDNEGNPTVEFTMEQLRTALQETAKLSSAAGADRLREEIALWFDEVAQKQPCFTPDWNALATHIRSGKIAPTEPVDFALVDLSDEKIREAYLCGLGNIQAEIQAAQNREYLRIRTALKLRAKSEQGGLGVRSSLIGQVLEWIEPRATE